MLSLFSHVRLFVTPWTVACQTPLSMGFSRQEYWSGLLCPPPWDLLDSRMEPCLTSPALTGRLFPTSATWERNHKIIHKYLKYINLNILSVNNVLYKKMCLVFMQKDKAFLLSMPDNWHYVLIYLYILYITHLPRFTIWFPVGRTMNFKTLLRL